MSSTGVLGADVSGPPPPAAATREAIAERLSTGARAARFVRRQPTLVLGVVVLGLIVVAGVFAPAWWTGDPLEMRPAERLTGPTSGHWFGTDNFGRDVYTRTIYGTRVSLIVGATVAVASLVLGSTLCRGIRFVRRFAARPGHRLLPTPRRCHDARDGRPHGHPGDPARTGADGADEGERPQRHHRPRDPGDPARDPGGPRLRAFAAGAHHGRGRPRAWRAHAAHSRAVHAARARGAP